jgi:hypothetical protein
MTTKSINYCTLTHFDAFQCVLSHTPWWITDVFWLLAILLVLSLIEYFKGFIVTVYQIVALAFGPGLVLIQQGINWLYNKVKK